MKAWKVIDKYEDTLEIFHAETRGKAIQEAVNLYGISWGEFFEYYTIKRCPEFDDREWNGLHALKSGVCGYVPCDNCGTHIYSDFEIDPDYKEVVSIGDNLYCSSRCAGVS